MKIKECRDKEGWCIYDDIKEVDGPYDTQEQAIDALRDMIEKSVDILFVGGSYSPIENIRQTPMAGPVGVLFKQRYLAELTDYSCGVIYAIPSLLVQQDGTPRQPTTEEALGQRERLTELCKQQRPRCVVALGKSAKLALGDLADVTLPHPGALYRLGDCGEVGRKIKIIKEMLKSGLQKDFDCGRFQTNGQASAKESDLLPKKTEKDLAKTCKSFDDNRLDRSFKIPIAKANTPEQVVAGTVLDPYSATGDPHIDAHSDWVPPQEVRAALYQWMKESRQLKLTHAEGAESSAYPVESYIFPYPSLMDQERAERGEDHRIYQKMYGPNESLAIHSGAWVLFSKVPNPAEWEQIEQGKLNSYSIEGLGARAEATEVKAPIVEIIKI